MALKNCGVQKTTKISSIIALPSLKFFTVSHHPLKKPNMGKDLQSSVPSGPTLFSSQISSWSSPSKYAQTKQRSPHPLIACSCRHVKIHMGLCCVPLTYKVQRLTLGIFLNCFSTWFSETLSLTEPGVHGSASLACQWTPGDLPISTSPDLVLHSCCHAQLFTLVLFTDWTISPTQNGCFCNSNFLASGSLTKRLLPLHGILSSNSAMTSPSNTILKIWA